MADQSYTLDDIVLTTESGEQKTIAEWQDFDPEKDKTVKATTVDGVTSFEFDDPTGFPRDVVVYTAGRPS